MSRGLSVDELGRQAREFRRSLDTPGTLPSMAKCPACGHRCPAWQLAIASECHGCVVAREQSGAFEADNISSIPEKFRWADLEGEMVAPGGHGSVVSDEAKADALLWLAGRQQCLVIAGRPTTDGAPSGVGKTSLAAGLARVAIRQKTRVRWVRAAELGPVYHESRHADVLESVRRAGRALVVVDGVGKELALASPSTGVISQRVPPMQELFALVYELPNTRFVFTFDITGQTLRDVYGVDAVRRIAKENATIIAL